MANTEKLQQQEIEQLNIEVEEVGLEELIILGETKKIPIHITFPNEDGTITKSKALIKQLTLKQLENLNLTNKNTVTVSKKILQTALFKTTGEPFTLKELDVLPIGVVFAISSKIMEISGMNYEDKKLENF